MASKSISELEASLKRGVLKNIPLKSKVSFKIGGSADYFSEPSNEKELISILKFCCDHQAPYFLLGSGTNLLIRDGGLRSFVVHLSQLEVENQIEFLSSVNNTKPGDTVLVRVPAFMLKAHLLEWSLREGYEGLEFSSGIPGSVGGGIFMNAGTRWGAYSDIVESARFWSPAKGVYKLSASEMGFKYRGHNESVFGDGAVVLSVDIALRLSLEIEKSHSLVSMILSYRGTRQPLNFPNCGSVFKNPENSKKGAGRMVEACGLKGKRIGGAMLSDKHANFILNVDHASAQDVEDLMALTQQAVQDKFQVLLEPEVIVCGSKKRLEEELLCL